jgi:menaquinone-dependent protoporphyrinogen IX oxidase
MKAIIVYHSHYGNTAYIVRCFQETLALKISVDVYELRYAGGKKNIVTRIFYRMFPALVRLEPLPYDLKDYDLIIFGIAVMAGHPSSAMAKYLSLCRNLMHKKIICCYVYSIEASMKSCVHYVEEVLRAKNDTSPISLYVPWSKVMNKSALDAAIQGALTQVM